MSVIINELEVVVDSAEPAREAPDRPAPAPRIRPEDISDVVERRARALARVLAH